MTDEQAEILGEVLSRLQDFAGDLQRAQQSLLELRLALNRLAQRWRE